MRLYLIRHGETALNVKGCYYGRTDAVLSEKGISQARYLKEILKEVTQKYVYTYGVDDLSENDKECIRSLIGNEI